MMGRVKYKRQQSREDFLAIGSCMWSYQSSGKCVQNDTKFIYTKTLNHISQVKSVKMKKIYQTRQTIILKFEKQAQSTRNPKLTRKKAKNEENNFLNYTNNQCCLKVDKLLILRTTQNLYKLSQNKKLKPTDYNIFTLISHVEWKLIEAPH